MKCGHTLVELLVAMALLEVGIAAVAGSCLLASRLMTRAEDLEWGVAEAQRTLDSLASGAGGEASGEETAGRGRLRWSVSAEGAVRVEYLVADTALVTVEGRLVRPGSHGG